MTGTSTVDVARLRFAAMPTGARRRAVGLLPVLACTALIASNSASCDGSAAAQWLASKLLPV